MELTKMLFNNLTVSASNTKTVFDGITKTNEKFENYMKNVSSDKNTEEVSYENNVKKSDSKNVKDSDKTAEKTNKKANAKPAREDGGKISENNDESDKKTDASKKTEISEEEKTVILDAETELEEKAAEILGVDAETVENALEQLGMNIFELADTEKLLEFLQEVFQTETPADLLTIDGIKNMIVQIKETVDEKLSDFKDLIQNFSDEMIKPEENFSKEETVSFSENADMKEENTLETETEVYEQGTAAKPDKTVSLSLREKNESGKTAADDENIQMEDVLTIKTDAETDMQNSFGQQGFQNNNMNFENNAGFSNGNGISATVFNNIEKAFSQAIAKNETMRNVNTAEIINQIIDKFKSGIVKENVSQIKVTLKPEYLGDVSLKIVSENGIVSAQFTAENQRIKEIIESNFTALKNMLDEQGIQVAALSVSVGGEDSESERRQFEFGKSKSSKRINSIIDESSEDSEDGTVEYVDENDVLQTSVNYMA